MEPYRNLTYNLSMDAKKKLDEAYKPEQATRKEKVVIGLSGGLDSFVTAYLLKIQKYDLIAVTVASSWEYWDGDVQNILTCQMKEEKLDKIREFCHKLNIPHYIIKNASEFREEVIEPWIAKRLEGKLSHPDMDGHALKMRLLFEKMRELKVKFLATGHYAKVFQQDGGIVFVHSSNDEENDQSGHLSRLPSEILSSLMLPLSDLTKKEVLKLAENFGVEPNKSKMSFDTTQAMPPDMIELFEKIIPAKLRPSGMVESIEGDELGEHEGVYKYSYGSAFEAKGKTYKGHFVKYVPLTHKMLIAPNEYFIHKTVHLTNCCFSQGTIWNAPQKGYVMISHEKVVECWIYPKTLNSAHLELIEAESVKEGQILTVLKKKGKNAKVYLTGVARCLPMPEVPIEGEESVQKVDYTRDY